MIHQLSELEKNICAYQLGFRNSQSCEITLQLLVADMKQILDTPDVRFVEVFNSNEHLRC